MKNIICIIAAAGLLLSACTDNADDKVITGDASIDLSRNTVSFPASGGTATIAVSTNSGSWEFTGETEWMEITKEGASMTIRAEENLSEEKDTAIITVKAGSGAEKYIYVTRESGNGTGVTPPPVNLSENGTANSYIVKTGGHYMFDATVKGNGYDLEVSGGLAGYIETFGVDISGIEIVDLMWESVFSGDRTASCDVIDGAPRYENGHIYFKTGRSQGNALIAARKIDSTVLWSWHIWILDDEITFSEGNGLQWMDRNLGAMNNTPADPANRGLLYQWGRKDPFMPSKSEYEGYLNEFNGQTGDGKGAWDYTGFKALAHLRFPGNLPFAVEHPMTYILRHDGNSAATGPEDWYVYNINAPDAIQAFFWGDFTENPHKTIFDPCPPGYTVPNKNAFLVPDGAPSPHITPGDYGFYWTVGSGDYFPMTGTISQYSGKMQFSGINGKYWTKMQHENSGISYYMYLRDGVGYLDYSYGQRSESASVRCVKEVS